ncbi:uncharacterized protein [Dendropsophus ebraccatus]|uniref:uncharacterized protein n=1 Tax=Dendropsophus ebraccatus TaxID=150705 RepID=UPI003831349F
MGKMFYYVTVIGVVLQVISGQDSGIEKMKQCPCANEVIEVFLGSVDQNTVNTENGQKLKLRLWQQKKDDCSTNVLDKSPKPGRIEISMAYQGSVDIIAQGEDQYRSDNDEEQQGSIDIGQQLQDGDIGPQQGSIDIGQQLQDGDIGPQQGVDVGVQTESADSGLQQGVDVGVQTESADSGLQQGVDVGVQTEAADIGPQQGVDVGVQTEAADSGLLQDVDIQQLLGSVDLDEFKQTLEDLQEQLGFDTEQDQEGEDTAEEQGEDIAQEQAGIDSAQRQSVLPNASYLGTEGGDKDYSAVFSFTVDVNTGKLSESVDSRPMSKRRKRDIKPFDTVTIHIKIDFYKKSDSVVTASDEEIKALLRKPLGDYWLAMVFCLLDVKQ